MRNNYKAGCYQFRLRRKHPVNFVDVKKKDQIQSQRHGQGHILEPEVPADMLSTRKLHTETENTNPAEPPSTFGPRRLCRKVLLLRSQTATGVNNT